MGAGAIAFLGGGTGGGGGFRSGGDFYRAEDQVLQGGDEGWGIAYGRHHAEAGDAGFLGVGATVDIDLVESFDVFGDEGDGDDHGFLDAFVTEFFESGEEARLEPFGGADFALEAKHVDSGPVGVTRGALFADEANRFDYMFWIWIALFDEAHREAVGTEEKMDARGIGKLAQAFADVGDECFDVQRMIVEGFDAALGKRVDGFAVDAAPFLEAAECGGVGIVGIERE